jgi:hypothetical protein
MVKLIDLPESLLLYLLQYLVIPSAAFTVVSSTSSSSSFQNAFHCMLLSRFFRILINKFIKQEIYNKSKYSLILSYQEKECTLLLYSCLFSYNIFLIGGSQDTRRCDVFNTKTSKFRKICTLSNKRSEEFDAICYQGYLLVISGLEESSVGTIEVYDIFSNRWYPFPSLPKKLVAPSSVVYDNRLFIIGGVERTSSRRSSEIYELMIPYERRSSSVDIQESVSHQFPSQNQENECNAESKSFVLGSDSVNLEKLPPVFKLGSHLSYYHFDRCYWELSPFLSLTTGRSHHSVVSYNGLLWIAGGILTGQWIATNNVEVLNPLTGTIIPAPSMLRNRLQPKLLVIDDCLYAVGGDMEGTVRSISSIERFDLTKPGWVYVTFFHEPRRRAKCAITAVDHKIYVFGGSTDGGNTLSSWDFYNTRTKVWASQMKSFLQEGDSPPTMINGIPIPKEEVDFIASIDFSTIPVRSNGLKSALALSMSFS